MFCCVLLYFITTILALQQLPRGASPAPGAAAPTNLCFGAGIEVFQEEIGAVFRQELGFSGSGQGLQTSGDMGEILVFAQV